MTQDESYPAGSQVPERSAGDEALGAGQHSNETHTRITAKAKPFSNVAREYGRVSAGICHSSGVRAQTGRTFHKGYCCKSTVCETAARMQRPQLRHGTIQQIISLVGQRETLSQFLRACVHRAVMDSARGEYGLGGRTGHGRVQRIRYLH